MEHLCGRDVDTLAGGNVNHGWTDEHGWEEGFLFGERRERNGLKNDLNHKGTEASALAIRLFLVARGKLRYFRSYCALGLSGKR
jgi:hypothetical protein